jgi:beta-glucosidase
MHSNLGLAGLAGLLATASVCLSAPTEQNITSDTYFYGQSPPVYPSRMSLSLCIDTTTNLRNS